jgi:hypothetical protein
MLLRFHHGGQEPAQAPRTQEPAVLRQPHMSRTPGHALPDGRLPLWVGPIFLVSLQPEPDGAARA